MKIIENKKDKLIVIVSALFISLYAFGTVFAGTLLKDDEVAETPVRIPAAIPVEAVPGTGPVTVPTADNAVTQDDKKTNDQKSQHDDDDKDKDDD